MSKPNSSITVNSDTLKDLRTAKAEAIGQTKQIMSWEEFFYHLLEEAGYNNE